MKKLVVGIALVWMVHTVVFSQSPTDKSRRISVAVGETLELRLDKDACVTLLDDYSFTINILGRSFNALLDKGTTFPVPSGQYTISPPDNPLNFILLPAESCPDRSGNARSGHNRSRRASLR